MERMKSSGRMLPGTKSCDRKSQPIITIKINLQQQVDAAQEILYLLTSYRYKSCTMKVLNGVALDKTIEE